MTPMSKNGKLANSLLSLNKEQSAQYARTAPARKKYFSAHPTKIVSFECMDGRINAALSAGLPFGIFSVFRSMGGIFHFGVSHFGEMLVKAIRAAREEERDVLLLATYHFSKGDVHRGCKGYNYDTQAAFEGTERLRKEIAEVFASEKSHVYPIVLCIETDEDAFIVHGEKGKLETGINALLSGKVLRDELKKLFPDMRPKMREDLAALLEGNIAHSEALRKEPRSTQEMMHCENVIAIGTGFDWIHSYNRALIIGPWSYDLGDSVATAAGIVLGNLKEGRVSKEDGAVLLCSATVSENTKTAHALAEREARSLAQYCGKIIADRAPEILPFLEIVAGTTDAKTKKFTPLGS